MNNVTRLSQIARPHTEQPTEPNMPIKPETLIESENIDTLEEIYQLTLPESLSNLADQYEDAVGFRSRFLWKWAYTMVQNVRLSTVPYPRREKVRQDKTIGILFTTLLDDFGEREGYESTFREAKRIPSDATTVKPESSEGDTEFLEYTQHVWDVLVERLSKSPRYDEFEDIFRYDVQQTINSIEFSDVVNENIAIANPTESMSYGPHNMMMFPMFDIDLMNSPDIDDQDVGPLREITDELQKLARIGNWVTTWEREIDEGDFTAGVFTCAIDSGVISLDDIRTLRDNPTEELKEIVGGQIHDAGVEGDLLNKWQAKYEALQDTRYNLSSVNPHEYIEGMRTVLAYHLASRGHK